MARDALADEVARYEQLLRRRAGMRAAGAGRGDAGLAAVLRTVQDRRAERADGAAAAQVGVPAPTAPAPAGAGPGRILAIDTYGPTVRVFRIGRPPGFAFVAGQHLKLGAVGGKRATFSIASAPHDPHLEVAVERRAGGRTTPALFALGVGDAVDLSPGAKGGLRLDPAAAHHLMVATVTGIAPLRSMLRAALHAGTTARFTVLVGASLAVELPFHDELEALAASDERVTYQATVSRPGTPGDRAWSGATGRVDGLAQAVAAGHAPATTRVYAVGHPGMLAWVSDSLCSRGFPVSTESYGN